MGQACAISSFMTLSHGLRCAERRSAAHRFKACPANSIRLEPLPVDTLRKAAGDVSALDLAAWELMFCRPAHGDHLLVAYHVSAQMYQKRTHLKFFRIFLPYPMLKLLLYLIGATSHLPASGLKAPLGSLISATDTILANKPDNFCPVLPTYYQM